MKLLKTLLLATISVVLFSCGNTQSATTTSVENTPDTKGTIREVADMDDTNRNRDDQNSTTMNTTNSTNSANTTTDRNRTNVDNSSTDMDYNSDMSQRNNMNQNNMASNSPRTLNDTETDVYWNDMKNKDQKSMYEYTNMSEDQILKYQRGYTDYIDKMQNKNMRMTIDQRDLIKQRDGILYDILKPAQYDKYQQWKMKNPNGGM